MKQSLAHVPLYPLLHQGSRYIHTGTLGRSIDSVQRIGVVTMRDFNELARTDREAAIQVAIAVFGYSRAEAERLVAIQAGEDMSDIIIIDQDGNERPYDPDKDGDLSWLTSK